MGFEAFHETGLELDTERLERWQLQLIFQVEGDFSRDQFFDIREEDDRTAEEADRFSLMSEGDMLELWAVLDGTQREVLHNALDRSRYLFRSAGVGAVSLRDAKMNVDEIIEGMAALYSDFRTNNLFAVPEPPMLDVTAQARQHFA